MKKWEQEYARAPMAAMFDRMPGARWITNPNIRFAKKAVKSGGFYESGRPDAFVCWNGRFIATEAKADCGSLYLGNPNDEDATDGFHYHQRKWREDVANPSGMAYWLAVWIHTRFHPKGRIYHKHARMYLVPAELWLSLEEKARKINMKTVPLAAKAGKLSVSVEWKGYELEYVNSVVGYQIPVTHPIWGLVK